MGLMLDLLQTWIPGGNVLQGHTEPKSICCDIHQELPWDKQHNNRHKNEHHELNTLPGLEPQTVPGSAL